MKRILFLLIALMCLSAAGVAQQASSSRRTASAQKKQTVQKKNTAAIAKKKGTAPAKGRSAAQKKGTVTQKKGQQPTVKSLRTQSQKLHQDTEAKKKRAKQVENNVRQGMQSLLVLSNEIDAKRRTIDTIQHDITSLDADIVLMSRQLDTLSVELEDRKQRYKKSLRYMHRNRNIQSQLMFVFSADNLNQMYRRIRFNREYATFQRAQGEAVKQKQEQLRKKQSEVSDAKQHKRLLLARGEQERQQLEGQQNEQRRQVDALKKEQQTLNIVIAQQQKQEADLNARIDRMIAEEIARAKARAEAEAKRKAEAEARKKRQEELARKRAAAEAARKENERRIAEAKAAEEQAKREARAAARKDAAQRAAADRKAREAEAARKKAERQAREEETARSRDIARTERTAVETYTVPAADRKLSGSFESNKGRLPMPITGAYRLVRNFGSYTVEGLKNVRLDSKGIHLKGQPGAKAQCVFEGEVSGVYVQGQNNHIVMVRHGKYISVYCNLASVYVRPGQHVAARQALGSIGGDGVMQFQLRNWKELLNPMRWLGR